MSDLIRFPVSRSPVPPPPQGGVGSPEWRAALLAEAIRHTAHLAGPIGLNALFEHLRSWLGLPEEACGGEINAIVFLMVGSGLYTSNTYDAATRELWLRHDTQFTPSSIVTAYLREED